MTLPYTELPHLDPASTPPQERWGLEGLCSDQKDSLKSCLEDDVGDLDMEGSCVLDRDEVKRMALAGGKRVYVAAPPTCTPQSATSSDGITVRLDPSLKAPGFKI